MKNERQSVDKAFRRIDVVDTLHKEVWGQGYPVDAMWFSHTDPRPPKVKLAFRLDADEWQGQRRVRFLVEAASQFSVVGVS